MLNQIEQGYQMEKPDGCPDEIYTLMQETWRPDRTVRPSFSQMLVKLRKIQAKIIETWELLKFFLLVDDDFLIFIFFDIYLLDEAEGILLLQYIFFISNLYYIDLF